MIGFVINWEKSSLSSTQYGSKNRLCIEDASEAEAQRFSLQTYLRLFHNNGAEVSVNFFVLLSFQGDLNLTVTRPQTDI